MIPSWGEEQLKNHMIVGKLDATYGQAQSQWFTRLLAGGILGNQGFLIRQARKRDVLTVHTEVLALINLPKPS